MCLDNDPEAVDQILKSNKNEFICYKFLCKKREWTSALGEYYKQYLISPYRSMVYKPGINKSNTSSTTVLYSKGYIYNGIHVYRLRKDCLSAARSSCNSAGAVIVKFTGKKTDLLGANERQMVFSEVYLSKEEYQKHIKPKEKKNVSKR